MSVIHLSPQELGTFVAICVHHKKLSLADACHLAEAASVGNSAAWEATYQEYAAPVSADEIEREALHTLAKPHLMVSQHICPIAYNMISNNGEEFGDLDALRELEDFAHKWQESKRREQQRQHENDESYSEVGPLPVLTEEEIRERCENAGCQRVIIARFRCDESDSQSDYWGGRTAREVVIGFGKGKRENFTQLRKAAATFEPTAHLAPGKDEWSVWVNLEDPKEGHYTPHHKCRQTFQTEAEAEAWITSEMEGEDLSQDGIRAKYHGYSLSRTSVENRENYSMGGGNYLGTSRYGGWSVYSRDLTWKTGSMEFHEPPRKHAKGRKRKAAPKTKPEAPALEPQADYTDWL